jgi:hypothetical protein
MFRSKIFWGVVLFLFLIVGGLLSYTVYQTYLAHTTFERYYAFRGCVQLVDKTDTYGDCKLSSGQTIKMVLINNKWYLNGDGPGIW